MATALAEAERTADAAWRAWDHQPDSATYLLWCWLFGALAVAAFWRELGRFWTGREC